MQVVDELFMFLVRLRLGLFEKDLAFRFQIHISSEITRCCGTLDLLKGGCSIMVDIGFDIQDLLLERGVQLNVPPFLQSQAQFSSRDVQQTIAIASLRIDVERAIRRIKEYNFFDSNVPLNALGSISQLYTVACLLTNCQGPLIANPSGVNSN